MIVVVEEWNSEEHAGLVAEMFRLRARVFGERLRWDVTIRGGKERDALDDEAPVYLIDIDHEGRVVGSCRLLPTTGPTLISTFFSDTLPDAALLSAPSIWECTRFCIDHERLSRRAPDAAAKVCGELLTQIGVLALSTGIDTVIGNFDVFMLRLYRRLGCDVEILGCTHRFQRPVYLGAFPISRDAVASGLERFPQPPAGAGAPALDGTPPIAWKRAVPQALREREDALSALG